MLLFDYNLWVLTPDKKRLMTAVVAFVLAPDAASRLMIYDELGNPIRNPMLPSAYKNNGWCVKFHTKFPVCDVLVSTPWGSALKNRLPAVFFDRIIKLIPSPEPWPPDFTISRSSPNPESRQVG